MLSCKQNRAFTIPELLVGMTILAILATIGFISLVNYNSQARDSARLTDVRNINNILSLNYTQSRVYPHPTDGIDVTFSGATVWTQGVFGAASAAETGKIFGELRDPKYGNHYTYSVTSNRREYQLAVLFESAPEGRGQIVAEHSLPEFGIPQAYADTPFSPSELNPIIWLDAEDVSGDGNTSNNPNNGDTFTSWINKGTLGSAGNPTVTHGNLQYSTAGYQGNRNSVFLAQNGGVRLEGSTITQGDIFQVIQNRNPFGSTNSNGRGLQSANHNNYTIGYNSTRRNSLRIGNSPSFENSSPATTSGRTNPFIYGFHTNGTNYSYRESGNVINNGAVSSIAGQTWAFNRAGSRWMRRSDFVVGEILIFDQVLSSEDRQKVEGYLAHKWDMTDNLASTHPYKNTPPTGTPSVPPNSTPDAFTFNNISNAIPDTLYSSNSILVQGINIPSPISISGGEYSIDGGSFTSESGTVTLGQSVQVRRISSSSNSTSESVTVTIGGVSGTFTITTIAADTTPDIFIFNNIQDAELGALYYSNEIQVTGINVPVSISISGDAEYRVSDGIPQNITGGGIASASSQENANNAPANAFNGNTGTSGWGNNNQMPAWLRYDFGNGNPQRITRYTLYRSSTQFTNWNWNGYSPRNWTFEGSNNGTTWTVLDTQTNQVIGTNAAKREFAFENIQYYRYYRINISSNNHGGSNWVNITEMELISEGSGTFTSSPGTVHTGDVVTLRMNASSTAGTTKTTTVSIGDGSSDFSISTTGPVTTPNGFSLNDIFDANTSILYESNSVTITGINTASPISITGGGEYRINGGTYTSSSGNIEPNDIVQVRLLSPASFSSTTSTTLTIGGVSSTFNISTPAPPPDPVPDDFSFTNITDAGLSTSYSSDSIVISGINVASPVSITGGEYRINGAGGFTSSNGSITNGSSIELRVTSADTPGQTRNVTLTIGGVSSTWSVTTIPPLTSPDPFTITAFTDAELNQAYTSNPITVSGINVGIPISISGGGGQYNINGGAWRNSSQDGTVYNGDIVRLRLTSSAIGNTSTSTTLNIGGENTIFTITTLIPDVDVDPFVFQYIQDAFYSTPTLSDTITISGINTSIPLSVSGGEYRIGSTGSFTDAPASISNGDTLTLRLLSGPGPNIERTMTVQVGDYSVEFRVRTRTSIAPTLDTPQADSGVMVTGNYNGILAHARDGDNFYIIATPSIIAYDLSNTDVEHILAERKLVYNGFRNIPESYREHFEIIDEAPEGGILDNIPFVGGQNLILNGGFDFRPEVPLMFEGERKDLASYSGLKHIHEGVRTNYRNFIAYRDISQYLDDHRLNYLERILSQFVGINPIRPYYCSDIKEYRLIDNIAPLATITASPAGFGSVGVEGIANGVISTEGNLDYEYHSAEQNASIFFEWNTPQRIGFIKIFNRTGCCSERLSGANIKLYNEIGQVIYSHPLWDTAGEYVIDLDLEGIGQMHFAKSLSIETVNNNYLNLREVEIYLGGELRDGFYKVDRDGAGGMDPYTVYCDMTTDGGGWTRIGEDFITNGQLRNQNHVAEHTFAGYGDITDNIILAQVTENPPAQIPDAHVLRHNGGASSAYQMYFDRIPGEYFAQEIRLSAWVRGTSTSIFHNRIEYADGSVSVTQPEGEIIDTSDGGWRYEQVRIPLTNGLVDDFYWNAGQGAAGPFFMTGFKMEVYYR